MRRKIISDKPWDKALKTLHDIPQAVNKRLADAEARIRVAERTSKAIPKTKVTELNSISSPLTEKVNSRLYYDDTVIWDSTGFFSIIYKPLKQVTFVDARGQEIVFEFLDPVEP